MLNNEYANEPNQSRSEDIIQSILDNTEYDEEARSRIEYLLIELKNAIEGGGGGGGVTSYAPLTEKPKIDNHTLQAGNNTSSDLGLQTKLAFDSAPTENSTNPVESGGVYTALDSKANSSDVYNKSDVDTALTAKADKSTTYTKSEVDTALSSKQNTISDLSTIRSGAALGATAVQPVSGKGLSTNDYTTAEKTKLAGIDEGAEVNVQSNWTQTTTTADDYIKNKPTLGTAAAKNATDTYNATGNDVTTGKAVAAALATLPEPMVFKGSLGTGGTITTLPTASSSNKGYVYKVITAGTYASQSAKVGDTFISDGSAWVLIPSGDEPSGTVTNVAVANGGGLTVSGSPITSSGTITVGHSNSVTAKTSSSVKKFAYDAYGHVTGSSELSTAESNALASGIDSTKVEQIETNENNISSVQAQADWNSNTGVTNLFDFDTWKQGLTAMRGTLSFSGNSVTVQATSNDAYTKADTLSISVKPNTKYILTWSTNATTEHNGTAYIFPNVSSFKYTVSTNERLEFTTGSGDTSVTIRFGVDTSGDSITYSNIMFRSGTITDNTYQPYAMSNADLTAKEQVNENNISFAVEKIGNNLVNVPSGSGVRWIDVPVNIPTGVYTFGFSNLSGDDSRQSQVSFYSADSSFYVSIDKGNDVYINNVTFTNTVTTIRIYASTNSTTSVNQGVNFTTLFLCKQETWNPSVGIQPYAMSNAELTAKEQVNENNILSIWNGNGSIQPYTDIGRLGYTIEVVTLSNVTISKTSTGIFYTSAIDVSDKFDLLLGATLNNFGNLQSNIAIMPAVKPTNKTYSLWICDSTNPATLPMVANTQIQVVLYGITK